MNKETISLGIKKGVLLLIGFYQHTFSILLGPSCRFTPSCSCYASTSIDRFGVITGAWLSIRRLLRCHPFHRGGYDPVPERVKN